MIEELGIYNIEGYYLQNGVRGEQNGKIIHYSDGRIVGQIQEMALVDGEKLVHREHYKLVLGHFLPREGIFDFLKIARMSEQLNPVA
jgi:hypothetical protein